VNEGIWGGGRFFFFCVDPPFRNRADKCQMSRETAAQADFELARKCLDGDVSALARMQGRFSRDLHTFLLGAGATKSEADELLTNLWTDCITGKPLLLRYRGTAPLIAWLKTVLMNDLVDRRRRQSLEKSASDALSGQEQAPGPGRNPSDAPLFGIMRRALTHAFGSCPAESVVMLQLVHLYGLTQREVCTIWGYTESKVSRRLSAAVRHIAHETMRAIGKADEWLEIQWEDFLEFCRGVE
jgi:RNA polymerase sigma factor (sigma-70 family)